MAVVRKNSIRLPSDRDTGTYLFGFPALGSPKCPFCEQKNASQPVRHCAILTGHVSILSEHSLIADGLLFCRLLFRSRTSLSAEVLFLRKQLAFYEERQVQPRRLNDSARFSQIFWSRLCNWKEALVIVKPETLIGWHRKGFQLFWKGKSQAGRPRIPENIRKLIVQMAKENPTWGQARVAAELSVKLGIYVSPRTVRAYWPPRAGWTGPPEDLFAELEDVCPQSRPVHGIVYIRRILSHAEYDEKEWQK
jgi:hypothetical protein